VRRIAAAVLTLLAACTAAYASPKHSRSPSPTASPPASATSSSPTPFPSPTSTLIGSPHPLSANYNPGAGATVVDPIIDCNADPLNNTTGAIGIIVDDSNTTIINPSIRECINGIQVHKKNGVMPTNVRIIADANYVGYDQTNLTLDRAGIKWDAGNGEIGDVSASGTGGQLNFVNDFRAFWGSLTTSFRLHNTHSTCTLPCPWYTGADSPGMHWDLKFIYDRTLGAPHAAINIRIDHNFVQGFDDEGISFDPRGNEPDKNMQYATSTLTAKTATTLTISNVPTTSSTAGMWVKFLAGSSQGRAVQITARNSNVFTVSDPNGYVSGAPLSSSVVVGGLFQNEQIDHNTIDCYHATAAKSCINNAGMSWSTMDSNTIYDTPYWDFISMWPVRSNHQCIVTRSQTYAYAFDNSIRNNSCTDAGDISAFSKGGPAFPVWMSGNTFSGSPLGQEWRSNAPQPAADPNAP
jgi:hypothetical protein